MSDEKIQIAAAGGIIASQRQWSRSNQRAEFEGDMRKARGRKGEGAKKIG